MTSKPSGLLHGEREREGQAMEKLSIEDRANNLIITQAYSKATELEQLGNRIKNNIIERQPTDNVPNKSLILESSIDQLKSILRTLIEANEVSSELYRKANGLK